MLTPQNIMAVIWNPVLLSTLFPPISGKMASKLWDGTFVDMQDMLPDNMALLRQLDEFNSDKQHPRIS